MATSPEGFPRESLATAEFLFDDVGELLKEIDRIDEDFNVES